MNKISNKTSQVIIIRSAGKYRAGDKVNLAQGYARYLVRFGEALNVTEDNLALWNSKKASIEQKEVQLRNKYQFLCDKIHGLKLVIHRQADKSGHLYGKLRVSDVLKLLKEKGYDFNVNQILFDPVKEIGEYKAIIRPYSDMQVDIKIQVANI